MSSIVNNIRHFVILLFLVFAANTFLFGQNSGEDEFLPVDQNGQEQLESEDEFLPMEGQDEFEEFDEFESFEESDDFSESVEECSSSCAGCGKGKKGNKELWWVISILGITIVSGFMVRYKRTRNLRGLFLIASLVVLGFYKGGCPCPIMSLHHVIFAGAGIEVNWRGMLWLLGLLPITYLFGKVWCGWICHLGALQEFIHLPGKVKLFQSAKAQKVMRGLRIFFLLALILQVVLTQSNIFKTIDPFKVAFNLRSSSWIGWALLGLTLLSSVFIYRPFCKTVCPIGLILGWVTKIPGASILAPKKSCVGCSVCDVSCKINAITRDEKVSILDNQECIACGNCVADCRKDAMSFVKNSGKYDSKTIC